MTDERPADAASDLTRNLTAGPTAEPTAEPSPGMPLGLPHTAVVTGAGRGIGRALATGLAAHGYDVGLLGRTDATLAEVAAQVAATPGAGRTVVAVCDLTDPGAVRAAAARLEAELGGVGLLVNNAGVLERCELPFADDDVADVWRVVESNVRGPLQITHALLPGMLARGGGRVVNLNSGLGHRRAPAYTGYALSKAALARLTANLDAQYRDRGIRAFDLAPGVVATDMATAMPMHADRTAWTPVEASLDLLLAVADGRLDALSGRFLRAGDDTVEALLAHAADVVAQDARCLRLVPYGPADPLNP